MALVVIFINEFIDLLKCTLFLFTVGNALAF